MISSRALAVLASVYNVAASADMVPQTVATPSNAVALWSMVNTSRGFTCQQHYIASPDPLYSAVDVAAAIMELDAHLIEGQAANNPDLIAYRATLATPRHIAVYLACNPGASWGVTHHVYDDGTGHYHAEVTNAMGRSQNMVCNADCNEAVAQLNELFRPLRKGE